MPRLETCPCLWLPQLVMTSINQLYIRVACLEPRLQPKYVPAEILATCNMFPTRAVKEQIDKSNSCYKDYFIGFSLLSRFLLRHF